MALLLREARWVLAASALALVACGAATDSVEEEEVHDHDPADQGGEILGSTTNPLTALTGPIAMRSGAWWGDVKTPLVNQVWGEVLDATPGKSLTAPQTYSWTCDRPEFAGFQQSLKLTHASISVDSDIVYSVSNPAPKQVVRYTLDPAKYSAGWHEIRIRCKGKETVGDETGEVTAITAGFPVQFGSGTSVKNHSGTNFVDTHGWYDRGVDYAYATILNISDVVGRPLSGIVPLVLTARTSGATTLDHFLVKIDDQIASSVEGRPLQFSGTTTKRTVYIDTRTLANGRHTLAMHSHGLENATSEKPGQQIAAQVEVTIEVRN